MQCETCNGTGAGLQRGDWPGMQRFPGLCPDCEGSGEIEETKPVMKIKRSRIFMAAWLAAEKALPAESRALIEQHDRLYDEWRKTGWVSPTPPELVAAGKAVENDALASIAFDLRQKTNDESHKEWREENP